MDYKLTIGLEIHAELKTQSKMFCSCKNDPEEKRPNFNICPVCLAHPGTLPVINKEAVKNVLKVGLALGGTLADETEFDRKNYFYPDIPKGYQISQYKYPLVSGGELLGVKLTRIHLEEDTGKSSHEGDVSLVDFNRAGLPLMELVTEPCIHSSKDAALFAMELQKVLQYLGVSSANMEKGEMRLEANISVSKNETLGTKVEVKNLNSFKSIEKAIEYELKRQVELIEGGGQVIQETRGWNDSNGTTFSQRAKETSKDYRYFPDPDLPKLKISEIPEFSVESLRQSVGEIPSEKRERFKKDYGLKDADIEFYIQNSSLTRFFEECSSLLIDKKGFQTLSNLVVTDIASIGEGYKDLNTKNVAELVDMFLKGDISSRVMKDILPKISNESPRALAGREGLLQKSDGAEVEKVAQKIIEANPSVVEEYKAGKVSSIQFLLGQAMKETKGSINPQVLRSTFEKLLSN